MVVIIMIPHMSSDEEVAGPVKTVYFSNKF